VADTGDDRPALAPAPTRRPSQNVLEGNHTTESVFAFLSRMPSMSHFLTRSMIVAICVLKKSNVAFGRCRLVPRRGHRAVTEPAMRHTALSRKDPPPESSQLHRQKTLRCASTVPFPQCLPPSGLCCQVRPSYAFCQKCSQWLISHRLAEIPYETSSPQPFGFR